MSLAKLLEPRTYIPKLLKIRNKDAQLVPFVLNNPQQRLLKIIEDVKAKNKPIRIIILKARQMGFSTLTEGLIFTYTATKPLMNSQIVAHEDPASQNLYQMYKTFYENLPPELTPMTKYSNSQELLFENPTPDIDEKRRNPGLMSRVRVSSARNVNTGRSMTIHNLHASEVAFWADAKTLMTGLMQTIPDSPNTMIIMESTANGVGGYFYDMWNQAVRGENDFIPVFFPWFELKEYAREFDCEEDRQAFIDEVNYIYKNEKGETVRTEEYELMDTHHLTYEQLYWRRYTIRNKCNNDIEQFNQEYPATPEEAFIASGRPRFSAGVIKQYLKTCKEGERGYIVEDSSGVHFVSDPKGYVEVWKHPEKDRYYCIGADVAEGKIEGDYSDARVGSDDFDVWASWHGHIDPDLFGDELVKLAKYYNEAYIGVERNNHGLTTLKAIQRKEYWNVYFQKTYDKIADKISQTIGWLTTSKTKPLMVDKLAEFIREKWIGCRDKMFWMECLTYVIDDKGATNAQEGCNDDTVMSTAILLQMLLEGKGENYRPEIPNEAVNKPKDADSPSYNPNPDDDESKPEVAV
jgi:hypothetical protein